MSVTWTGDTNLAVVRDDHDLSLALQNPHVVAVLDVRSGTLTGVHAGTEQITVRAGAMSASASVQVS
jgi:uncharacterized protein YjdB